MLGRKKILSQVFGPFKRYSWLVLEVKLNRDTYFFLWVKCARKNDGGKFLILGPFFLSFFLTFFSFFFRFFCFFLCFFLPVFLSFCLSVFRSFCLSFFLFFLFFDFSFCFSFADKSEQSAKIYLGFHLQRLMLALHKDIFWKQTSFTF